MSDHFFNAPSPAAPDRLWCTPLSRLLLQGPAPPPPIASLTLRLLALRNDSQALIGLDSWPPMDAPDGSYALALHGVALEAAVPVELDAAAAA